MQVSHLDLRDNHLEEIAENAFLGLENNLKELRLDNNRFLHFPLSAVKILKKLQVLSLAQNSIDDVSGSGFTKLASIHVLDLGTNRFVRLTRQTLAPFPNLKRLSMASNGLLEVGSGALDDCQHLESLDLSHNSLSILPSDIFARSRRIKVVNLSWNR